MYISDKVVVLDARSRYSNRVDFLKCVGADQVLRHLTCYDDDWRGIHVSVRDSSDGVGRARSGSYEHYTYSTGRSRIALGHVDGALFVPDQVVGQTLSGSPKLVVNM
jgi:hypothetical protein